MERDELDSLIERSAGDVVVLLDRIALAEIDQDPRDQDVAERELARVVWQTQVLADLHARAALFGEADAALEKAALAFGRRARSPLAGDKAFDEAVDDLISREPRLARSSKRVRQVYQDHGFALAKSARLETTKRVQRILFEGLAAGEAPEKTRAKIEKLGFSKGYAQTVYRTNVATAYSAGRFAQMFDPEIADVMAGFRFSTAGDSDVRENHEAADGVIAAPDDSVWDWIAPPLGFNCRCTLELVTKSAARRRGLVRKDGTIKRARLPIGARADDGFGRIGRPDRTIYGGRR